MAQRLPHSKLTAEDAVLPSDATVPAETDVAMRKCQRRLSMPSNLHWIMLINNVDRDHHDKGDTQAYTVQSYFPQADHGSILITSRLASLQRLSSGVKWKTVGTEQARTILKNNAGRMVEGKHNAILVR
jgi:hypothetical protein